MLRGLAIAACGTVVLLCAGRVSGQQFPDGAFGRGGGPENYYIEAGARRSLPSSTVLECLGGTPDDVVTVTQSELDGIPRGPDKLDCNRVPLGDQARRKGWVNNYFSASQHTEFQKPSQRLTTWVYLFPTGEISGASIYENDELLAWCAGVTAAALDADGNALHVFEGPSRCLGVKTRGARVVTISWRARCLPICCPG